MIKNLQENEIFLLDGDNIEQIYLSENGDFRHKKVEPSKYSKVVFLMRYIGNHLCEEYYTNKKIQILDYDGDDPNIYVSYNTSTKYSEGKDKFLKFQELNNFVLEFPLCFELNAVEQLNIDSLTSYGINEDSAKDTINKLEESALLNYKKTFNKLIAQDYQYAVAENMVYEMKKRILKKGE